MVYSYDQWAQMPVKDLYDTQIMAMSIAAAKDMYEKGQKQLEDFNTKYGDFMSPITKDMDWYNKNVTGKVRDTINNLYANGIDPLRSAERRAAVAQLIYSMPTGEIAKLRESAEGAKQFLKSKAELQARGLYNPLLEQYDGISMSDYSTLDNGVWDRMSPTPYQNMAAFSKDYFDNIKPFTRAASKNGISYTKSEITEQDLHNIADAHFNDLVNTPQGQLMYKMYLDQTGGDKNAARQAFNNAVVSGNRDRLFYSDDYNDNWFKQQQLNISRATHALAKKQYDDSRRDQKIGLTDIIKDAVRQKINSAPYVNKTGNKQPTKMSVIKGQDKTGAISNYNMMTVPLQGEAAQSELEKMFYGWSSKADEKYDIVNGQNRKRITFTETSGLYPTLQRAYDYKGYETKGLTSAFTKYLRRNKVYGYPLQEDFTVTYNANANNNIFDVNQYVEINKDQLEGFFKQRYTTITHRSDYSNQDYENYKKSAMRQLGISEQPSIYSKIPINDSDNKLQWQSKGESYLIVPITRSKEIVGLGQSQIDTDADKDIVSKDKLSEVEKIYQERDIKRRNK